MPAGRQGRRECRKAGDLNKWLCKWMHGRMHGQRGRTMRARGAEGERWWADVWADAWADAGAGEGAGA